MDANFDHKLEALIALVTELKCQTSPVSYRSNNEQTWLNCLATVCSEASRQTIALAWTQTTTQVDFYIASSLPITDPGCFEGHLKDLWGIICDARTHYKADQGSTMSGWVDQVKNKVFPRLENQLSISLNELDLSVGRLSSLANSDAFDEAIKVINEKARSKVQVRRFFDAVCRHAEEWKDTLRTEEDLQPLAALITRISNLNAAMRGLVEDFVTLSAQRGPDILQVHLIPGVSKTITLPSTEKDWSNALPNTGLRCTPEALRSAIQTLSNRGTRKEWVHPVLVLFTFMQSHNLVPPGRWNIGCSSKICQACAECIDACSRHHFKISCPYFQSNTDPVSFSYPWALPPSMAVSGIKESIYQRIHKIVCVKEENRFSGDKWGDDDGDSAVDDDDGGDSAVDDDDDEDRGDDDGESAH